MIRVSTFSVSCVLVVLLALSVDAQSTTNVLRFSTEGQSLWGPDREGENVKGFKVDILDDHIDETVGEIKRYDVEVDNQRAVDVWERAVAECDAWKKYGLSPTRSQCINGASLKYPCPTWSNPLKTCTWSIPRIGPKPAGAIDMEFDVGAEMAYELGVRWGVEGSLTVGEGSVDVDVDTTVEISMDTDGVSVGDVFTMTIAKVADNVEMSSR